jgi:hypothetical protein
MRKEKVSSGPGRNRRSRSGNKEEYIFVIRFV